MPIAVQVTRVCSHQRAERWVSLGRCRFTKLQMECDMKIELKVSLRQAVVWVVALPAGLPQF